MAARVAEEPDWATLNGIGPVTAETAGHHPMATSNVVQLDEKQKAFYVQALYELRVELRNEPGLLEMALPVSSFEAGDDDGMFPAPGALHRLKALGWVEIDEHRLARFTERARAAVMARDAV